MKQPTVIVVSTMIFGNPCTMIQLFGFAVSALGVYAYGKYGKENDRATELESFQKDGQQHKREKDYSDSVAEADLIGWTNEELEEFPLLDSKEEQTLVFRSEEV